MRRKERPSDVYGLPEAGSLLGLAEGEEEIFTEYNPEESSKDEPQRQDRGGFGAANRRGSLHSIGSAEGSLNVGGLSRSARLSSRSMGDLTAYDQDSEDELSDDVKSVSKRPRRGKAGGRGMKKSGSMPRIASTDSLNNLEEDDEWQPKALGKRRPGKTKRGGADIQRAASMDDLSSAGGITEYMEYECGYCFTHKVSTSSGSDGRVRIRCECGGKHQDKVARMHAKWVALPSKGGQSQQDLRKRMRAQWNVPLDEEAEATPEDQAAELEANSSEGGSGGSGQEALAKSNGVDVWENGLDVGGSVATDNTMSVMTSITTGVAC